MPYSFQIYIDEKISIPKEGDTFRVTSVEQGVVDIHWGTGTHVELVPVNDLQPKEIIAVLQEEISWCENNPNIHPLFQTGFIAGLKQAIFLIRRGESLIVDLDEIDTRIEVKK